MTDLQFGIWLASKIVRQITEDTIYWIFRGCMLLTLLQMSGECVREPSVPPWMGLKLANNTIQRLNQRLFGFFFFVKIKKGLEYEGTSIVKPTIFQQIIPRLFVNHYAPYVQLGSWRARGWRGGGGGRVNTSTLGSLRLRVRTSLSKSVRQTINYLINQGGGELR